MKKRPKTSDIKATISAHMMFREDRTDTFGMQQMDDLMINEEIAVLSNEGSLETGLPLKPDFFGIILCISGRCEKTIGPFNVTVEPESIHLITPRYITSYRNKTADLKLQMILFKPEFLTRSFIKYDIISQLLDLDPDQAPIYPLDNENFRKIESLYRQIDEEKKSKKPFSTQVIRLLLIQILYEINRACEHCRLSTDRHQSRQVAVVFQFKKLVEQHFLSKRTVQEYADLMNISPKYLLELVKNETGQTALNVIRSRVYLEAQYLLSATEMNIKEVSLELGFDTSSHFSRFFKQFEGKSPMKYQLEL